MLPRDQTRMEAALRVCTQCDRSTPPTLPWQAEADTMIEMSIAGRRGSWGYNPRLDLYPQLCDAAPLNSVALSACMYANQQGMPHRCRLNIALLCLFGVASTMRIIASKTNAGRRTSVPRAHGVYVCARPRGMRACVRPA